MKILFLLFLLIPVFEITIFITFIGFIGFLNSVLEIIISFLVGFFLFFKSKKSFLGFGTNNFGVLSFNKVLIENKTFSFFVLIGSLLLILPGYIGDIVGIFLMVKPIQNLIIKYIIKSVKTPFKKNSFYANSGTDIIEGEFFDLHNDKKNISKKR